MRSASSRVILAGLVSMHKSGKIRKYLGQATAEKLVHAFITSHLDCCNSLLAGLLDTEISKLQRLQNASARLLKLSKQQTHITPI